jgi:hypothetical protein
MGAFETVEAGGTTARLYTAGPVNPGTRAVVVLHPWWGLNEDVIAHADRLVAEGFAIARQHVSRVPIIGASSQGTRIVEPFMPWPDESGGHHGARRRRWRPAE